MQAEYAIIGGSGTFSINFPESISEAKIIGEKVFKTPYGESPPFKLFEYNGKKILTLKMHGWRKNVSRANSSLQVFWVLKQAGVKKILSEGGVGSLKRTIKPRDLIIPDDFIDLSGRRNLSVDGSYLLIMRKPCCAPLRKALIKSAKEKSQATVFGEGIYVCTDGNRFETKAEIKMMKNWGDVVGQSMACEASLARDIGACFASLQMVVNFAEGIVDEWDYEEFKNIFFFEAKTVGKILLNALDLIDEKTQCKCQDLRKPSLLK